MTPPSDHTEDDHRIDSTVPIDRAQQVLARHLCGWITGHHAPLDHMLPDAEMILKNLHQAGVRFHLHPHAARRTMNESKNRRPSWTCPNCEIATFDSQNKMVQHAIGCSKPKPPE